jgi:predicted transcriptional regulator
MNKTLSDLLERAQSWPESARSELEHVAREIEAELKDGVYHPTAAESRGIERGLRDSADGKFASAEEVEMALRRLRTK